MNQSFDRKNLKTPPSVGIQHLDCLWFQVAGTLCNLSCNHCFISCNPKNDSFGFLKYEQVEERLLETKDLGIKEYYFTGGEPFLNKDIVRILLRTLDFGPVTVLTNGTVLKDQWLDQLKEKLQEVRYGIEFRVSIDGYNSETNDPIRGEGTFKRAVRGVGKLVEFGFMPIITVTRFWEIDEDPKVIAAFKSALSEVGYRSPRIKILPTLKMGAEENRDRGYKKYERIDQESFSQVDPSHFVCHNSRIVSDRGVHVCPILLDQPGSVMSSTVKESLRPFPLTHGACYTCFLHGSICSNVNLSQSKND